MKSKLLISILLLFLVFGVNAQNEDERYFINKEKDTILQVDGIDYLSRLFKINKDKNFKNKKIHFSFFPIDAKNAVDRVLFSSFNATFLLGDKSSTNNSTVYFIPYLSFKNQYGVELYPTIWLNKNSWNLVGEYYVLNFPQETWGLGGNSPKSNETLVDRKQVRVHQNVLKGIAPNLAIGIGFQFDEHFNLRLPDSIAHTNNSDYPGTNTRNSVSSGVSIPIVYDNRKNIINPEKGFYTNFTYLFSNTVFGSDKNWQSVFLDVRKYFEFPVSRSVLGFRSYYWSIVSGRPPYFDLPATRTEPSTGMSSRGIQSNRYRSNAMLYFESEYRFTISPNGFLGGTVFSSATSASEYGTQNFRYWVPTVGAGIRLKFSKYTKINVSLDFGVSKDYAGLYLHVGEAF